MNVMGKGSDSQRRDMDDSPRATIGDKIGQVNVLFVVGGVGLLLLLLFAIFAVTLWACSRFRNQGVRNDSKPGSSLGSTGREEEQHLMFDRQTRSQLE
ncbi:hypothetical protein Efla_002979 [Eimeria flavescens]